MTEPNNLSHQYKIGGENDLISPEASVLRDNGIGDLVFSRLYTVVMETIGNLKKDDLAKARKKSFGV